MWKQVWWHVQIARVSSWWPILTSSSDLLSLSQLIENTKCRLNMDGKIWAYYVNQACYYPPWHRPCLGELDFLQQFGLRSSVGRFEEGTGQRS
jgi:hypothetical protein